MSLWKVLLVDSVIERHTAPRKECFVSMHKLVHDLDRKPRCKAYLAVKLMIDVGEHGIWF